MGFSGKSNVDGQIAGQRALFDSTQSLQESELAFATKDYLDQANTVREDAITQALARAAQIRKVREKQALDFSNSGVLATEGTPAAVMNETVALGKQELDFYLRGEQAKALGYEQAAYNMNQSARAQFLGNSINFNNNAAQARVQSIQSQSSPVLSFLSVLGSSLSSNGQGGGKSSLFNGVKGAKSFFSGLFSKGSSGGAGSSAMIDGAFSL